MKKTFAYLHDEFMGDFRYDGHELIERYEGTVHDLKQFFSPLDVGSFQANFTRVVDFIDQAQVGDTSKNLICVEATE